LAHFRETKAHLPIVQAFSIPNKERNYIWGDMLNTTLPALLFQTADGDYSSVMDIVRDRDAYVFLRAAAMEALMLVIASGDMVREEGIALFATLFDKTLAAPKDFFWASLVCNLLDIYPGELIDEIRDLFAIGFVPEKEVSLYDVDEVMAEGFDATIATLQEAGKERLPEDVHDYISCFACFLENEH
jgi:hypothetical protein